MLFPPINSLQICFNLFFCSLGCISCFYLQKELMLPSFLASILVGLTGSFLPPSKFYNNNKGIAGVYSGSFASMCSLAYFTTFWDLLILCLFVGLYFNIFSPYFRGVGGKLGTIGFLSSISFVALKGGLF